MSSKREILVHPDGRREQTWQGFSWPAFLFTPFWCLVKGLLLHSIISIIGAFTGIGFIFWFIAGVCGNEWHYNHLINNGFTTAEKAGEVSDKTKPEASETSLDKIEKLGRLKEAGYISDDEFNEQKRVLLMNI